MHIFCHLCDRSSALVAVRRHLQVDWCQFSVRSAVSIAVSGECCCCHSDIQWPAWAAHCPPPTALITAHRTRPQETDQKALRPSTLVLLAACNSGINHSYVSPPCYIMGDSTTMPFKSRSRRCRIYVQLIKAEAWRAGAL